jgi:hypothetical protein
LFAGDAPGRTPGVGAKEFQPAGFRPPEAMDFEHDALVGLFPDAHDPPRQVPLARPQVDQRIFIQAAQLAVQRRQLREPFPVLADFRLTARH